MRVGGIAFLVYGAIPSLTVLPSRTNISRSSVKACQFSPSSPLPCFFYCYYYGPVALRRSRTLRFLSSLKVFNCPLPARSAFDYHFSISTVTLCVLPSYPSAPLAAQLRTESMPHANYEMKVALFHYTCNYLRSTLKLSLFFFSQLFSSFSL